MSALPRDRRYGTVRWRKLSLFVRRRDGWQCWVPGCERMAEATDHIKPVYPGMPDHEFFSASNLRASCRRHNTARGVAARLERETSGVPDRAVSPFSGGGRSYGTRRRSY